MQEFQLIRQTHEAIDVYFAKILDELAMQRDFPGINNIKRKTAYR